jgi:hypothetical protein
MEPREDLGRVWQGLSRGIVQCTSDVGRVDFEERERSRFNSSELVGWEQQGAVSAFVFLSGRWRWGVGLLDWSRAGRANGNVLVWYRRTSYLHVLCVDGIEGYRRGQCDDTRRGSMGGNGSGESNGSHDSRSSSSSFKSNELGS